MNRNTGESGVVAIHRWFADGEGWAYHPWFQSRIPELLAAVKRELDRRGDLRKESGVERILLTQALGGYLLGKQELDLKCPDPRAAERFPTILRVVFLRRKPEEREIKAITDDLVGIQADHTGPNKDLTITPTQTPRPSRHGTTEPRSAWLPRRTLLIVVSLLILLIAICGAYLLGFFQVPRTQSQNSRELTKERERMAQLLKRWRFYDRNNEGGDGDALKVAGRFLEKLSQDGLGVDLKGNHPDVRFLSRLPPKGARPQDREALRKALEQLLIALKGANGPGVSSDSNRTLDKILSDIEEEMDYRRWWKSVGKSLDYAVSEKADERVSEHARKFLVESSTDNANSGWQRPAAEAMLTQLSKWKVEAVTARDVDRRPWMIFHCYFQLLSQRHFHLDDLRKESWQTEFVKRLPRAPLTDDGMFGSEDELIQKLHELAGRLRAAPSDQASTLVTNISSQMDYVKWKAQVEGLFARDAEKGTPKVARFVERFHTTP